MRYYAVIDTNVLVSALLTYNGDSPVVKVVDAIRENILIPMYNEAIMEEYSRVLHRERFSFASEKISELLSLMKERGLNCEQKPVDELFPDPDDIVFYEVAMSRENAYLVTGNLKHFPKNGRVVSPSDMIQIILFGSLPAGYLTEPDAPPYMSIPIEEIDAIIQEVRREMKLAAS